MPHNTAFASTIGPYLADAIQQCAYSEKLLVASNDLAHLAVKQHIAAQELQQPLRTQ